jgi:hypothetical protein
MNAGRRLGLIGEHFDFTALDVRRVIKGHGLERLIELGVSHAVLEPGKIAPIQDGGRGSEDRYAQL